VHVIPGSNGSTCNEINLQIHIEVMPRCLFKFQRADLFE